jgi:hypothetical protein
MGKSEYADFLQSKSQLYGKFGFEPTFIPDKAKDFQRHLIEWSLRRGRAAIFADCGLGKSLMQLAWAENVVRHTNRPVLILTPLAVAKQTVREGEKFGIECERVSDGNISSAKAKVIVTNYERLHHFDDTQFSACVCDESSILKNVNGKHKAQIIHFMRKQKYRLLCTATASPNDFIELGNSSEALGDLDYFEMLTKYFKNDQNTVSTVSSWTGSKWRFRGHAEHDFWRWVCSWARACRKPSDLGFNDDGYQLPELMLSEISVRAGSHDPEYLFALPAFTMEEQRNELRRSVKERCEAAAEFLQFATTPSVAWCHLNEESSLLRDLIPGAVEVKGGDKDEKKEEILDAFQRGEINTLVTKPKIAGFGLNWQHCAWHTFFPSHSFEQFYQAVRRSWRFGQEHDVNVGIICSEGNAGVLANLKRKAVNADKMFERLVELMNDELAFERVNKFTQKMEVPTWL